MPAAGAAPGLPPPPAAHVPARRGATACRCTTASSVPASVSSPSTWDWNRWSRHFAEVDQAESYASVLSFQLEEAVETEDFAEAASLKRAILEASADDPVAQVMADLKLQYCNEVASELKSRGIRAEVCHGEHLPKLIRNAETQTVTLMAVVGPKEVEARTLIIRSRHSGEMCTMPVDDFISRVQSAVAKKSSL